MGIKREDTLGRDAELVIVCYKYMHIFSPFFEEHV